MESIMLIFETIVFMLRVLLVSVFVIFPVPKVWKYKAIDSLDYWKEDPS